MTSLKNLVLIFFIICFFYFPQQFITIVNPVRISGYTKDIKETLQSQYAIVRQNSLPATWLLTYDILINERAVSVLKSMDGRQELGLFLEITPQFAEDAGVSYNNTGFWYHATSVFLSGYKQNDRKLLIDKLFGSFHDVFGYYPSSVGSWWTDSYSLAYMKQKYNISANLGCSDQFATDGYQIWGQYWSTPFYPSKFHAGIPASDKDVKLDLVTIQWASRDPLNGYKSSLYSTHDYFVSGIQLDTNYFEKLINLYAKKNNNQFGQITIGLEGDFEAETYKGEYKKQLEIVSKLVSLNEVEAVTMSEFSQWYRNKFPFLSPPQMEEDPLLFDRGV